MRERAASSVQEKPALSSDGRAFVDPPWDAPLDAERVCASVPADMTISGMFFAALVAGAKARGVTLPSARDCYTAFQFYPVTDLARLLVEAAQRFYPGRPLRHALRSLGRAAPEAFLKSTLGKVTLGSTEGIHAAVAAMANAYEVNLRPSHVTVGDTGPTWAVVHLERVPYFLDSHHVGTFEGVLRHAQKTEGTVRIASRSTASAELLLAW